MWNWLGSKVSAMELARPYCKFLKGKIVTFNYFSMY